MTDISVTDLYRQLSEVKKRIDDCSAKGAEAPDGWYDMYDLYLDGLAVTRPRTMEETVLVADILLDFCRRFIGTQEDHMLADERRMVSLTRLVQYSLHQLVQPAGMSAKAAEYVP